MTSQQYTQDGLPVPYIARWSLERSVTPRLVVRRLPGGPRLAFTAEQETLYDRDEHGALWVRQPLARGKGRARLDTVHAMRQRRAILHSLCQMCRASAVLQGHNRALYLLPAAHGPIGEGSITAAPPVCSQCAPRAVEYCPRLRQGWTAVWAEYAPIWGVAGAIYDPRTLHPLPHPDGQKLTPIEYGEPRIRWTLAHRQVIQLHGVTPVHDLYNLAA
ncbi:hypothetical protein [Streptomyces kronopolitis]|uniref:hypothetical protein n=1 Tax=Streptomyces kronopolitis TaxID=1612435 RepID=UPI003D99DD62